MGVSTTAGQMQLERMPRAPASKAAIFVVLTTAAKGKAGDGQIERARKSFSIAHVADRGGQRSCQCHRYPWRRR